MGRVDPSTDHGHRRRPITIDELNAEEAAETEAGPANDETEVVVRDALLVKLAAGDYETPGHRWRVRRNTDGAGCAPRSWWAIFYRNAFVIQAQNLATAKQVIAKLDRDFAKEDGEDEES